MNPLFHPQLSKDACVLWLELATENENVKSFQADYSMFSDMVTMTIGLNDKRVITSLMVREQFEDIQMDTELFEMLIT